MSHSQVRPVRILSQPEGESERVRVVLSSEDSAILSLLTAHNVWVTVRTDVTEQGKPAMSPRTDAAAWKRLGELLIRRRIELDPAYQNRTAFCTERGIDYRLAYDIEEARRTNFRKGTLAGVAIAYAVTLDSMLAVLDDPRTELIRAPAPVPRSPEGAPPAESGTAPARATTGEMPVITADFGELSPYVDAVWGEVGRAKAEFGPSPDGRQVFPHNVHEARMWEHRLPEPERVRLISFIRMMDHRTLGTNGHDRRASL